jgi:hypothetical protein
MSFLSTSEDENEITEFEWEKMWKDFKEDAKHVLSQLRASVSMRIDMTFDAKDWEELRPIIQGQPRLEMVINDSGPRTGWTRNPTPLFQELIRAVAEINQVDFNERLAELELLNKKAEDILAIP